MLAISLLPRENHGAAREATVVLQLFGVKKIIRSIILACLVLPAIALLAFGPRAKHNVPPGFVSLQYWEKWSGTEGIQMAQIVDDFNKTVGKEKGIVVEYMSMTEVNRKTLIATAAGVPPDIAGVWDGQTSQFGALDAFEPLDDLAAEYGIKKEDYKPAVWDLCVFDGHLYSLPSTPASVALLYNKRIFWQNADKLRAAGLDPFRAPETIDELDRYSDVLTVRDANGHIDRAGFLPMESWYVNYLCYWWGTGVWDRNTGQFTLTDPRNVAAYEWLQKCAKKLGKDSVAEFRQGFGGFNSAQNPFLTEKYAMSQQGPWMANYIYNLKPQMSELLVPKQLEYFLPHVARNFNYCWAAAAFPSAAGQKDAAFCSIDTLAIPRGAKHKREAFEFIAYVQRPEVQEKLCSLHCKTSSLIKTSDAFIRNHMNPYIDVWERLLASPNAHGSPPLPIMAQLNADLKVLIEGVYLLKKDPKEGLAELQAKMEAQYARYKASQEARLRAEGK
jgi:ABC-type glycerol-3-phosphate transport system substrate-binding protein